MMSVKDRFIYINLPGVDKAAEKMRKKETEKRMQEDGSSHGWGGGGLGSEQRASKAEAQQ